MQQPASNVATWLLRDNLCMQELDSRITSPFKVLLTYTVSNFSCNLQKRVLNADDKRLATIAWSWPSYCWLVSVTIPRNTDIRRNVLQVTGKVLHVLHKGFKLKVLQVYFFNLIKFKFILRFAERVLRILQLAKYMLQVAATFFATCSTAEKKVTAECDFSYN